MNIPLTPLRAMIGLAWRGAVRGKAALLLAVLLPAMIFVLPLSTPGSSQLEGESAVWLGYALRGAWIVLNLATLWLACAAIAQEIERHRHTLTAVKPLRPLTLWLGKWLGVLLVQGVLLALTGLAVLGVRQFQLTTAQDLRDGRRVLRPDLPPVAEIARQQLEALKANDAFPEGATEAEVLAELIRREPHRYAAFPHGEPQHFHFRFPKTPRGFLSLRLVAMGILGNRHLLDVTYELRPDDASAPSLHGTFPEFRSSGGSFNIPADAWQDHTVLGATLILTRRPSDADEAGTLLIRPRQDIALLCEGVSFSHNLLRALLVQFALIGALAAFGLTLGIFFSFPVALYMAFLGLLVVQISSGNVELSTEEREASRMIRFGVSISEVTQWVIPSARETDTLRQLLHGEAIDSRDLLARTGRYLFLIPLLCALPGAWALKKKEL